MYVGEDQPFQILDENAVEVKGAVWSIDSSEIAELQVDSPSPVLRANAPGTVHITAVLDGHMEQEEIHVWQPGSLAQGSTKWSIKPLGTSLKILPAVPIADSDTDIFSLEQDGRATYVRAFSAKGMQHFLWTVPEATQKVRIVCGDWLGGLILAASHNDSYVLYVVGFDGALKWTREFSGNLNAYAVGLDNVLFLLNQPANNLSANIFGLNESTGEEKFKLEVPQSRGEDFGLQGVAGGKITCGGDTIGPLPIHASRMFINIDGDAYIAFTQLARLVTTTPCQLNSTVDPTKKAVSTGDQLVLWRIHSDGTYVSHVLERTRFGNVPYGAPFKEIQPTGEIIPDGLGGVLVSIWVGQAAAFQNKLLNAEEFIYRVNEEGEILYRLRLPAYEGPLHDAMVLGEGNTGFVTRGDTLMKFDVLSGTMLCKRKLPGTELEVALAIAGGGVVVNTKGNPLVAESPSDKGTGWCQSVP